MANEREQALAARGVQAAIQLAGRSLVLRGLTFGGTLVLARLLQPADFGVYAVIAFLVAVFASFGDFGLGAALVQRSGEASRAELATAWWIQQAIGILGVGVIWTAAPLLVVAVPDLPADAIWMVRVASVGLIFSALRALPTVMLERALRFGPLALADVAQQLAFYGVAIVLAAAGAGPWSFVAAVVGQTAVAAAVTNLAWRQRPSLAFDRSAIRPLFGFGLDFQIALILSWLRDGIVPFAAGLAGGAAMAGLVQFAWRVGFTISSMDEVVARVAFPAFSRLQDDRAALARAVDLANRATALIVAPLQCWVAVTAPFLIPALFGERWRPAVVALQLVCLGTLFRFPTRYLRQAVFAAGRSRLGLSLAGLALLLTLALLPPLLTLAGTTGAGAAFLISSALSVPIFARLAGGVVRVPWVGPVRVCLAALLAVLPSAAAVAVRPGWLALLAAAASTASLFAVFAWALEATLLRRSLGLVQASLARD